MDIYELKKKYLYIIQSEKNIHNQIYSIVLSDNIQHTKDGQKIHIDLERIKNHTWCKIKEYVDVYLKKKNMNEFNLY